MNVEQFANELKVPSGLLIEQLQAAGVSVKGASDELSDQDKSRLSDYLRDKHGAKAPKTKITLTRKQTSEIKTADSSGKSRTIQVEVRKKRVLVKREAAAVAEEVPAPAPAPAPTPEVAAPTAPPVIDAEELKAREEEARRQAELRAVQEAELKAKQEREAAARRQEEEAKARSEESAKAAPVGEKPAAKPEAKKPSVKPKVEKTEVKKGKAIEEPPGGKKALKVRGALESEGGAGVRARPSTTRLSSPSLCPPASP